MPGPGRKSATLSWGGGGSLRIGENTRIRFTDTATAFLEEGRVYFDSVQVLAASDHAEDSPAFTLATEHGNVRHLGTQYMVEADAQRLVVSVREGEVVVAEDDCINPVNRAATSIPISGFSMVIIRSRNG